MKKLYLFLMAMLVAVAANAADWYLVGANFKLNGKQYSNMWSDNAETKFTQSADNANVYTLEFETLAGEFKIKEAGTWNTALSGNGQKITEGTDYSCGRNGGNITCEGTFTNGVITANVSTGIIKITGQSQENDYNTIYIVGDINGGGWNEDITTYPLTLREGTENEWVGSLNITSTSYFKMRAGNNIYGTGGVDVTVALDTEYTPAMTGNAYKIGIGSYNVTFILNKNAESGKLTVTSAGVDPTYPELYFRGDINSWSATEATMMTEADGVYTIALDKLTGSFKIANADWSVAYTTSNTAMELGTAYDMEIAPSDGGNMGLAVSASDVTVTFDYENMKLTIAGTEYNPVVGYRINSDLTAEEWSMAEMTEEEGKYIYQVTPLQAEGEMQVVKTLDGSNTDYMGNAEATISEENTTVTVSAGAGNLKYNLDPEATYKFTFDPETSALSVEKITAPVTEYPVLYLRGAVNDWGATEASLMTETNGVYTITLDKLSGDFKIADEEWAEAYTTSNSAMELGTAYDMDVAPAMGGNMAIAGAATDVTVTFDFNTMKLTVAGTPFDPAVGYKINSDLTVATWSMEDMTEEDGKYIYVVTPAQAAGEMQVVKTLDGTATDYMGNADATISEENSSVTVSAGAGNLKYNLDPEATYKFTFDPETSALSVEKTTVEPPITVEYKDLYLVGEMTGWTLNEDYKFERTDNVYTLITGPLSGEWKIWDGTWDYNFGCGATQAANETCEAWFDGGNFTISTNNDTTITFTLVEGSDEKDSSIPSTIVVAYQDSVESVIAAGGISVADGTINVAEGQDICIFNTAGALISRSAHTAVATGLYIVVVDGHAAKVLVK